MPANDNARVEELSGQLAELLRAPVNPAELPVRFSRLKRMGESPAHYYADCQRQGDAGETLAMRLGSGTHAMIFDQPHTRYSKRRAGKDWDKFQADNPGHVILNDREWAEAQNMAVAILQHREAAALLLDGTIIEQHIAWSMLGRDCSSRPDAMRIGSHIVELKTARSSRPAYFARDAIRMHYHGQLAFYGDAVNSNGRGIDIAKPWSCPNYYVVAVEKLPPHVVTVYRLTDRAIESARKTTRLWFEQLLACEDANYWPGYSESIVDLDVPESEEPIELEVNGELIEVGNG
jgi:hypothetical protein